MAVPHIYHISINQFYHGPKQKLTRKPSLDAMDSDAEDTLIDESNIDQLVKELPQATDRTVQFLDNLLAVLPNRYKYK